ncbi:hypothetical protein PCYB_071730 [Plasmodium cynomolgi strain B]|uniref:Subpellicular microtubule protein 1 n=1 Tax=Plasmodium cynomolgi (strain B) TaxID=1120755 RepID=K6UCY7_PLACD|nr:hypothetical protein PCYB_071730 [Plasmodium cynomolgi strain B]GAB65671.1 hypothetical protein PCYB_071730 [Plasmodium cynomolgi strain B]
MEIIAEKPKVKFNFVSEDYKNCDSSDYSECADDYGRPNGKDYFYANRILSLDRNSEQRRKESPSKRPGLCVDEICTCGFHRCPKIVKPLPFDGESNYRIEFGPKPLPELPPRQEAKLTRSLPFEGESNYRSEFGPKPLPELPPRVEQKPLKSLPFEGESNYRSEFGPKALPELPPRVEQKPPKSFHSREKATIGASLDLSLYLSFPHALNRSHQNRFLSKGRATIEASLDLNSFRNYRLDRKPRESSYRSEYVRKAIPICPVNLLPKYPAPTYPSEHVFWDSTCKRWY